MSVHTGFTSSDSDIEEERRAECVANTSFSLPSTSPLAKTGKANSTLLPFGKNLSDFSYAAGYSTIASKRRSSSVSLSSRQPTHSNAVPMKQVNSTLKGVKWAKNVLDLSQQPMQSPITPTSAALLKTIPTSAALYTNIPLTHYTAHYTIPLTVATDGDVLHKTASDSAEVADKPSPSSADNWITEDEEVEPLAGQVNEVCRLATPRTFANGQRKPFTTEFDQLQEEGDTNASAENSVRVSSQQKNITNSGRVSSTSNQVKSFQNSIPPSTRGSPVGRLPVANSTPVQSEPVICFETSPSIIHSVVDSELQPPRSERFTFSMYSELGSSPPISGSPARIEKMATAGSLNDGGESGGKSRKQLGSESSSCQREKVAPLQLECERTPPVRVDKSKEIGRHGNKTMHRPAKDKVIRRKKLHFASSEVTNTTPSIEEVSSQIPEETSFPDKQNQKVYSARSRKHMLSSLESVDNDLLKYPARMQEMMRKCDEEFKLHHPRRFEQIKHIPIDSLHFIRPFT